MCVRTCDDFGFFAVVFLKEIFRDGIFLVDNRARFLSIERHTVLRKGALSVGKTRDIFFSFLIVYYKGEKTQQRKYSCDETTDKK